MLDCGFNLLVYGYGSKRDAINIFHQRLLMDQETIIFNGYHGACTIKTIIEKITSWFLKFVFQDQVKKKQEKFPKNVAIHEQINNIKREFLKIESSNKFEETDYNIVLIIHSMEQGALKHEDSQDYLAEFATIP